jgi:hypothetical protein
VPMDKTRCRILANWRRCRHTTSTILMAVPTVATWFQSGLRSDRQLADDDMLVTEDIAALRPLS